MQIFIDTASLADIERWLGYGVLDGATTNPTIMLKEGSGNVRSQALAIAAALKDKPLSVEVVADDPSTMIKQARVIAGWAPNIVVKIPIITTSGQPTLGVINALEHSDIRVNATACLTVGQAVLAAKAGATYVSLFLGRMQDEGIDAVQVIGETVGWLRTWGLATRVIVGSMRGVGNVQEAILAGAHIVTVPPKFLEGMIDHKYSRFTVAQFLADGSEAAAQTFILDDLAEHVIEKSGKAIKS